MGSTVIKESSERALLDAAKAVKDPSAGVVNAIGTGARYVGFSVGAGAANAVISEIFNLPPDLPNYGPIDNTGYNLGANGMSIIITFWKSF